jgi:hypothetical protein
VGIEFTSLGRRSEQLSSCFDAAWIQIYIIYFMQLPLKREMKSSAERILFPLPALHVAAARLILISIHNWPAHQIFIRRTIKGISYKVREGLFIPSKVSDEQHADG